jgi:hypothetical protein
VEAQGRTARCKRCGEKFAVPRSDNLEDTVLAWLAPEEDDLDQVAPPRVISMPHEERDDSSGTVRRVRGPIRMRSSESKDEEQETKSS